MEATGGKEMSTLCWVEILDAVVAGEEINDTKPGSPANETLSVPKLLSWQEGSITAQWQIRNELHNSRGELFGGYYGVLADVAASYTAMTIVKDDERFKTTDLRLSYFRPAFDGMISIEGMVLNRSRSFLHVEILFKNDAGKLLSKAAATFAVVAA